jgi:hypothetical protein
MREQDSHNSRDAAEEKARERGKKPYQKPAFLHERVFETMALSCGKVRGTEGQCKHNRKSS